MPLKYDTNSVVLPSLTHLSKAHCLGEGCEFETNANFTLLCSYKLHYWCLQKLFSKRFSFV